MLCNICQKREAKIYYTEIIKGEKKEQHLCEECAAEHTSFVINSIQNNELFLGGLLAGLLEGFHAKPEKKPAIICSGCGMSQDTFFQLGHFGCLECYNSFGKNLPRLLRNIHGGDTHVGKIPKGYIRQENKAPDKTTMLSEEDKMKFLLQQAIEKEEYEEAAKIRDSIRMLKKEASSE